jgi:hypothetical protein
MATKANNPTLNRTPDDEEIFVLRGQDLTSPRVVLNWIALNFETAPEAKLRDAFEVALAMRRTPNRKAAD